MNDGPAAFSDIPDAFGEIITGEPRMKAVFRHAASISGSGQPVLITGETGVGKELLARAIHRLSGRAGRFVAVNVAGLDDGVFSDTLFGHRRGAFTGADRTRPGMIERAAGGTLFLDEIGDLTATSQVKLLRLLQEGEYLPLGADAPRFSDARILAATNADLWALQRRDLFRKDLNYRLRTHHLNIPPLRERPGDVPLLIAHFAAAAADALGRDRPAASSALIELLAGYGFPGNVRELQSLVFDAVSRQPGQRLGPETFQEHIARARREGADRGPGFADTGAAPVVFDAQRLPTIREVTRLLVREAMRRARGNQTAAARMLGISQPALSKRLKKMEEIDSEL